MHAIEFIFFASLALIFLLLLYPAMAWLRSFLFLKKIRRSDKLQPVSIIIACSNEAQYIRRKIDSFLDESEWIAGSEIIVVPNNSKDATVSILKEYSANPNVQVIIERGLSSKIEAVNRGVKQAKHDLLVFSDCRQKMKPGSVKKLVENFNDPTVGTVNSTLLDSQKESNYSLRSLLNFISHCESRSGSSLNVFGALYAQRRSVFSEIPTDILFDDLFVTVSTLLQNKRLVAEKEAVIYDVSFEAYYQENRTRRLARGLLIFLFNHYGLIRQLPLPVFMRFMIFKYLKLLLPFVLLLLSINTAYLAYHYGLQLYLWLFVSVAGVLLLLLKPLRRALFHLHTINYNFMIATLQFLFFNKRSIQWDELKVSKTT